MHSCALSLLITKLNKIKNRISEEMPETGDTCEYLKDMEIVPAMVILFNSPVCVVTESKWVPENDSVL